MQIIVVPAMFQPFWFLEYAAHLVSMLCYIELAHAEVYRCDVSPVRNFMSWGYIGFQIFVLMHLIYIEFFTNDYKTRESLSKSSDDKDSEIEAQTSETKALKVALLSF